MTWTVVPELDTRLVIEAASQTHEIWSGGWSLTAHIERQKESLRRAGPGILRYIGLVDATGIVASMKRYELVVNAPGVGPRPAVGIGAIFTRKDARNKGAAAFLLRWLLDDARSKGNVLALLYSAIGTAYYERFGFVALPSFQHSAATNVFPETTHLEIHAASGEDEPAILAIHESSWDPAMVRIVRTPEHLRFFRYRNTADQAWTLRQGTTVVGYVIAALHNGSGNDDNAASRTLWVDEWVAPGIPITDVFGAIRHIAEHQSAERIAGWLSPSYEHGPFVSTPRDEPIAMACPLNAPITSIDPHQTFFGSLDQF
jgi:GNAT superfamily N-acetyltransferase